MGFRSQRDCCSISSAARVTTITEASKSLVTILYIIHVNFACSTCFWLDSC